MLIVKSKIIVVLGPTASGKSGVAIKLAQKFNGEIISADSRQIFKGLNIGSGKVIRQLTTDNLQPIMDSKNTYVSEGIVHHLIDVVEPMEDFNVSHFKKLAEEKIEDILKRGKLPIICGGTGFWIDAVIKNTTLPKVAPNELLRSMLRSKTNEELFAMLQEKDPERAKNIDAKNSFRLIRALEIVNQLGTVPALSSVISHRSSVKYHFLQIGIDVPKEILHEKIKKRLDDRFAEGMIVEVEGLLENGVRPEWLEKIGLEYRWISRFLQGKVELEEMKKLLYFDIIHYAKRQMTWFKKDKEIIWLKDYTEIEKEVTKFVQ